MVTRLLENQEEAVLVAWVMEESVGVRVRHTGDSKQEKVMMT